MLMQYLYWLMVVVVKEIIFSQAKCIINVTLDVNSLYTKGHL